MHRAVGKLIFKTEHNVLQAVSLRKLSLSTSRLLSSTWSYQSPFELLTSVKTVREFSVSRQGTFSSIDQPPHHSSETILQNIYDNETVEDTGSEARLDEDKNIKRNSVLLEACSVILEVAKNPESREKLELALSEHADADDNLRRVIKVLESPNVIRLDIGAALAILKCFNTVFDPVKASSIFLVKNIENSLMWKARNCSMRDLSLLLSFSVKYRPELVTTTLLPEAGISDTRAKLYKEVVKSLERRWVEISDARTFVGVLHYPECFSEQYIVKLEDRMTELVETLPVSDLVLILKDLGFKKRRPVPLLRAISYHLVRSHEDLDLKTISDCLFAVKELSFKDVDLLEYLSSSAAKLLISGENSEKITLIMRSLLTSLGQIRFLSEKLLDAICECMTAREGELQNRDLSSFVITTASLNYVPLNSDKLYSIASEKLTPASVAKDESKSDLQWLDIVWSFAVLDKVEKFHLESVLTSDFYNKLLYSHDHRNVGVILKLLNINAVAHNLQGYSGPKIVVEDDPLLRDVIPANKTDRVKMVSSIMDAFQSFASGPEFIATDINTRMGFRIDGEAIFDSKMKPLRLSDYETFSSQETTKKIKPLPEGAFRVAILVVGYHDCLVGSNHQSGLVKLCQQLLRKRGLKTLVIRFDDLKPQHKKMEKIKILEQKLKSLLSDERSSLI